MSCKLSKFVGCASLVLSAVAVPSAHAEEAAPAAAAEADENKVDEALQAEIRYVETLIDNALPDFAEIIVAATKKKWPESEAAFFALEIRGMLSLGKFKEAEDKIAALPDRNGGKYWAARLEVANNYFMRGRKKECSEIYGEFFKKFPTPPKGLREFYLQASYAYGQLLIADKNYAEAARRYEMLLKYLDKKNDDDANTWCNVACETSELYLRMASDKPTPDARKADLAGAKKLVDQLLWEQGRPVYFGRAIAMKANIELLKGDISRAQATIDDYMDQLAELHKSIQEFDPNGRLGLLRQSPMPLCRFMLADMYWTQIQAEMKKPKRDDNLIKDLMFGAKGKNGKRNGAGAYNHAVNVYYQYPESAWAAKAGQLAGKVEDLAIKTYGATIKKKTTPQQDQKVREMQFRGAGEKLGEGDYSGAIADYFEALASYPEEMESIPAIEGIISAYQNLILRNPKDAKVADWRLDADAVEGYLAERFAGSANKQLMNLAGEAMLRVAASEKSHGNLSRADRLYKAFLTNYTRHIMAATTAAALAGEAQQKELYADAVALWNIIDTTYTNSTFYTTALQNLSVCCEKLGDRKGAIAAMNKYCKVETHALKRMQAQMQLAILYQKDGFEMLSAAETLEPPEAQEAQVKAGNAQIIRGIKQFVDFAKNADKALADPAVSPGDKKQYDKLREGALYLVGDCWGRLTKPADKLPAFRAQSITNFEHYVSLYPQGRYAKAAYVKLGAMYTATGDTERSKEALTRLAKEFPDAEETKNAKPRLAKNLIEMGFVKEGTELYGEMLKFNDANYSALQYVNAGEALITARSWDLANQAFERAIEKAGTNSFTTVAKARIGLAKALYRQKSLDEAREALQKFLDDKRMARMGIAAEAHKLMAEVASEQGCKQQDDKIRAKDFGQAIRSVKALRGIYKRQQKPLHEQEAVNLMSVDVQIRRMNAEEAMGLKEQAFETCGKAAGSLMAFLQAHRATKEKPIDKMSAGELANLERSYETLIPLFVRLGDANNLGFALKYGTEYLELFPNGKERLAVQNAVNQAKAQGAVMPPDEEASAAPPAAVEDGEEPAETAAETPEEAVAEEASAAEEKESEGDNANE
ncbi:MAG: tetratricopeptide repeat protein [Kiritimatiellia bacterium]